MNKSRNQILGVRTTNDFINKFDDLCDRLGYNRSEVIRYVLKRFFNEHFITLRTFKKLVKRCFKWLAEEIQKT